MMTIESRDVAVLQLANPPLGGCDGHSKDGQSMALLALSHTPLEHQLYWAMFKEVTETNTRIGDFSARILMMLTGLNSFSAVRRARAGLLKKLSIERYIVVGDRNPPHKRHVYFLFTPEEIFARRRAAGLEPHRTEFEPREFSPTFGQVIERVLAHHDLSRREAQVALCCAEGLTNAQIGDKLLIGEQTVKFHLRHIFIKFRVKRRAELMARLLI